MPLRGLKSIACIGLLLSPACVVRLSDRNSPEENGGVTGSSADCSQVQVPPKGEFGGDAAPKFVGRFAFPPELPGGAKFDWSGNSITIRVQGTTRVTVKLEIPVNGGVPSDQVFAFVVDNGKPVTKLITVKTDASGNPTLEPQLDYDIELPSTEPHELVVYKNTEAQKGFMLFHGFDLHGGTLLPPTRRARRIEFIGDSIICGYGNEGENATCPFERRLRQVMVGGKAVWVTSPVTENQYLSFTSIAARELDADAVTVCWSGKGVYLNYKERPQDKDTKTTVPKLWQNRTIGNIYDPNTGNEDPANAWDFTKEEQPHVVFISLGTNDFARDNLPETTDPDKLAGDNIPDGTLDAPDEREKFFQEYLKFVAEVRQRRPDAHIFLATPPMVTDQFPLDNARTYLRQALQRIVSERGAAGDSKVYQMDLVEQGFRYGLGCDYHPNLEVHRIMARQLVGAIRSKTCW